MSLVKGCSSIARLNSKLIARIARKSITRSFAAINNINGLLHSQSLSNKSFLKYVAAFGAVGTALYSTSKTALSASAGSDAPADFITTKSGLKYKDTVVGTGATPRKGDKVKVHYTGWLKNFETGKKYDSSHDRFSPLDFTVGVGQVMQGWDEALLTDMKVGSQRLVIIPPELGYGSRGAGEIIPGNATLYNKMELVAVNNSDTPADFTTTKSGLAYKDTVVGTGATPKKGDKVKVHFTGWLKNFETGKKFDCSYDRAAPLDFTVGVGQAMQGWDEALLTGMKVGSQRLVIIPPELGCGPRGAGGVIPGNATLYFKMELVGVNDNPVIGAVRNLWNKIF